MNPLEVFDFLLGVLRFARKNYPTRVLVVGMRPHVKKARVKQPARLPPRSLAGQILIPNGEVLLGDLPPDFIHALRDPEGELIFIVRIKRSVLERMEARVATPKEVAPS